MENQKCQLTMNCNGVQSRYGAYVADELSATLAAQVEDHLASCAFCREWFEVQEAVGEALRAEADSHLPPRSYFDGLAQRIAPRLRRADRWEKARAALWEPLVSLALSAALPARMARAAAACAVGLWLGVSVGAHFVSPGGSPTDARATTMAAAPTEWVASPSRRQPAEPAARASKAAKAAVPITAASLTVDDPLPNAKTAFLVEVAPPRLPEGTGSIDKGIDDAMARGRSSSLTVSAAVQRLRNALLSRMGQASGSPAVQFATVGMTPSGGEPAVDTIPSTASTPSTPSDLNASLDRKLRETSIFEELKGLKFDLYRSGRNDLVQQVQDVEKSLMALSAFQDAENADYDRQMRLCQDAEEAAGAGDRFQAASKYLEVVRVNPDSRWACLARYELGNQEFDADCGSRAFQYYRKCLEDYPRDYLSETQRNLVVERLEALERQSAGSAQPLTLDDAGSTDDPRLMASNYLDLTRLYPKTMLARKAVDALTRLATEEQFRKSVDSGEIYSAFTQRLEKDPRGPLVPWYQFGAGEILNLRRNDAAQAKEAYAKAAQMTDDSDLRARAAARLHQLGN
ncbi:MAG: zf-HC2 domain-containing protein [Candidatus Sumerlaeota bacterium]|nr:zf-HC2 domain-containing protein [Candidatus Sumerlaeota bacterium]